MAKERIKNVTIPVYNQETLDRLTQHFPEAYSREDTLIQLLDAYDRKDSQSDVALSVKSIFALLPKEYQKDTTNLQNLTTAVEELAKERKNLLDKYQNLTATLQKLAELLPTEYQKDTTDLQNITTAVERFTTDVQNNLTSLTATVEQLTAECQNKEETCKNLMDKQVSENAIIVNAPEWSRKLLAQTAKRLSEKYNKTITPDMILLDMFNRYTIERWNQWFYPFVLNDREISETTGYPINTLKAYLKNR